MKLRKVVLFVALGMLAFNLAGCSAKNNTNARNTEGKQETKVNNKTSIENKQESTSAKENSKNGQDDNKVKEINSYTILSHEEMKEDLDSLVKTLENVHPKTYNGFSQEQKTIIESAHEKIKNPLSVGKFYFVVNEIICSFKDAHTCMYLNMNDEDKIIDLYPIWLHDGLYVKESIGELQKGDKILSMGGKTPEELLIDLSKVVPAENDNWIKSFGVLNIIKEPYLRYLNIIEDNYVNVNIQRKYKQRQVKLPLISINNSKAVPLWDEIFSHDKWVSFTIDKENSLGIFKLDKCIYNGKYKDELRMFFEEVYKNNIQNIVVDVRENTGGNSEVVDEFIRYLDIDKYLYYNIDIRYSPEASKQRNLRISSGYKSNTNNKKISNRTINSPELLFKGKVYALTSPLTFSGGNWFAVIFKDNNMGKIIGEPTGNQPSSYADSLRFKLPNSNITYQVSYKKFTRPNPTNDPEDYLTPDIIVYTTIDDIINERDSQMETLKEILKNNH